MLSVFLVSSVSEQGHPSLFWFLLRFFGSFQFSVCFAFRLFSLIFVAFSGSNKNRRPLSVVNFKATPPLFPTSLHTHVFCFVCSDIEAAKGSVYSATLHTADLKLSLRRALHLFGKWRLCLMRVAFDFY